MDKFLLSRLTSSIRHAVRRMNLDLRDLIVVTECATSAYSCTTAIAGLSGASRIVAFGKDSSYGAFETAREDMYSLWEALGLSQNILLATDSLDVLDDNLGKADIVTNSGHLRPLNSERIKRMKKGCVIPLMYESWEFRHTDLCLQTCQERGIPVAGTNERHPDIGVFDYLGPIAAKSLFNAGLEIHGNNIILICDNDFAPYLEKTLKNLGANVLKNTYSDNVEIDAIVFAHTPGKSGGKLNIQSFNLPKKVPLCCQIWGDVDRSYFETKWIPEQVPNAGYMGIKLSTLGVEAVVRLQAGGLKVAELMCRELYQGKSLEKTLSLAVTTGYAQPIPTSGDRKANENKQY